MQSPPGSNPIRKRLDHLGDLWNSFVETPDARVLRWLVDAGSAQMVDAFLELQREGAGDVPDYFLRFDQPFAGSERYGFLLVEELEREYEGIRGELREAGHPAEWRRPAASAGETGSSVLLRSCRSFAAYHSGLMLKLAVVLAPASVVDPAEWQRWLVELVRSGVPEEVRFLVLDSAEAPALDWLCEMERQRVLTQRVDLDMDAAREQLARSILSDDPGSHFRLHLVALNHAASKGDLGAAGGAAREAMAIATRENWPAMQVVVHLVLGAAYLGAGQIEPTLAAYRAAREAAHASADVGDPSASGLIVQSLLAEGAALVSGGRFADAARVYEEAAPLAAGNADFLMALEGWRMAAYCHEQHSEPREAWRCGTAALEAGRRLDSDARATSTLPYVGRQLLRIAGEWSHASGADAVRAEMAALLGPNWEVEAAHA